MNATILNKSLTAGDLTLDMAQALNDDDAGTTSIEITQSSISLLEYDPAANVSLSALLAAVEQLSCGGGHACSVEMVSNSTAQNTTIMQVSLRITQPLSDADTVSPPSIDAAGVAIAAGADVDSLRLVVSSSRVEAMLVSVLLTREGDAAAAALLKETSLATSAIAIAIGDAFGLPEEDISLVSVADLFPPSPPPIAPPPEPPTPPSPDAGSGGDDDSSGGNGMLLLLLLLFPIAAVILVLAWARLRYPGGVMLYLDYKTSHSMPSVYWRYLPVEYRKEMAAELASIRRGGQAAAAGALLPAKAKTEEAEQPQTLQTEQPQTPQTPVSQGGDRKGSVTAATRSGIGSPRQYWI